MIKFQNTITIKRPIEDVFRFVADPENLPRWNYYVISVQKLTPGPIRVGTHYHQVRKSDDQVYKITEYQLIRKIALRTVPGSRPEFEISYTFGTTAGGTTIRNDWELSLSAIGFLERLAAGSIREAVASNLNKLTELVETGGTTLQDGRVVIK